RNPEAIDEFHEAVRLDPDKAAPAHANLGWALLASGKAQESILEFEAALQLNPDFKAAADGLRQAQAQLSPQQERRVLKKSWGAHPARVLTIAPSESRSTCLLIISTRQVEAPARESLSMRASILGPISSRS